MSLFRRPAHLPPVQVITCPYTVRISVRIIAVTPCAGGFTVRYARVGRQAEYEVFMGCAPLPPGANEHLPRPGGECGLRLDGRKVIEVYPC